MEHNYFITLVLELEATDQTLNCSEETVVRKMSKFAVIYFARFLHSTDNIHSTNLSVVFIMN